MRPLLAAAGALIAGLLCLAPLPAAAAPDEIQVYTEELDEPGEFGLELHVNYAIHGQRSPSYEGETPSHHVLQTTPEFSYGISKTLEAGLYLPVAFSPDGGAYGNGLRFRLKYIAPRAEEDPFFWGLNVEYGYSSRRVAESYTAMELRPIIGYHGSDWQVAFNPILDTDLSPNVSRKPQFQPALKVTRRVAEGVFAGAEYYGDYGPPGDPLPASERSHYLFGVADVELKGYDLNIGLGRGFANAGDRWVAKAIIAFPFK